jgi:hypothetical protein
MASSLDQHLLPEFDSIKDKDERIIWTGRPKFVPFVLSGLWSGLFSIVFVVLWFLISTRVRPENDSTGGVGLWVGLIPGAILFLVFSINFFLLAIHAMPTQTKG